MVGALAKENTSVCLKMSDKVAALHSAAQDQRLPNDLPLSDGPLRESAIGPEHELDSLSQVSASLLY
jgi:hypothetical protein